MRVVVGFSRFWWNFIIGEDWRIAAGVAAVLAIGGLIVACTRIPDIAVALIVGAGILAVVTTSIVRGTLASRRG